MIAIINAGLMLAIAGLSIALGVTLRQVYLEFAGSEDDRRGP